MAGRLAYLVTGGAGFIGANAADRLLAAGSRVVILDNLSRPGVARNLDWLVERHGQGSFRLIRGDVASTDLVAAAARDVDVILHLAGQVAVTTSIEAPMQDFASNAAGTLSVLEGARLAPSPPIVLYASTNKVYGTLDDVALVRDGARYRFAEIEGIDESRPLDPISPYGCSKCAGDLYTRDYHRIYGLRTVVFRQSCIYGPRQLGIEDQGWLAWLVLAALTGREIRIFGDGCQVRDVLWIDDLLDAYELAAQQADRVAGQVYNLGGGPGSTLSVWSELQPMLEQALGRPVPARFEPWRPGDQRVFIADISKAQRELGWSPKVSVAGGIDRLMRWITANLEWITESLGSADAHHPPGPAGAGRR